MSIVIGTYARPAKPGCQDGPTIQLVPLGVGHAAELQTLGADAGETLPLLASRQAVLGFVSRAQRLRARGRHETFAVCHAGRLVGIAVLARDPTAPDRAELGYWIGRSHRGRGYATAAARRMVSHAFDRLGLALVYACCPTVNRESARVVEKLSFRFVGIEPIAGDMAGDPVRRYEMKRDEWSAR